MQRRRSGRVSAYDHPQRHRRGSSVGGAELISKPVKNDDGLSRLEIFLRDYKRVAANVVCESAIIKDLHVWVYAHNHWTQMPKKEKDGFLKTLSSADATQSVCNALMTNVFKLTDVQYQTMKNSLLSSSWRDVAGLYQNVNNAEDFAVVVRLPVKSSRLGLAARGLVGTGAGLAAPTVLRHAGRLTNLLATQAGNYREGKSLNWGGK